MKRVFIFLYLKHTNVELPFRIDCVWSVIHEVVGEQALTRFVNNTRLVTLHERILLLLLLLLLLLSPFPSPSPPSSHDTVRIRRKPSAFKKNFFINRVRERIYQKWKKKGS